jgi:DNA topoisomerase-3
MDLVIAEKPSLAEAIANELPGTGTKQRTHIQMSTGTVVTWCFGHLLEQCMPQDYDERYKVWRTEDLPIVPAAWKLTPIAKTSAQLTVIKGLLKTATRVIHAGDPDQEGQLIVDEVLQYLGNKKPVVRLLVNDYTPAKVRQSLANLAPNTDPRFRGWSDWARCRSQLDWLLGLNLSRAYTLAAKAAGHEMTLTVGRVQSPTLALIVNRDLTIEQFKSVPFYSLNASLEARGVAFQASWRPRENQPGLDADGRLLDAGVAAALQAHLSKQPASVKDYAAVAKSRKAPLPFYIDTLQMAANVRYGYTAKQTLEAAQSLYETHKLTTYPRTDCPYLSVEQHAESPARLRAVATVFPALAGAVSSADLGRVSPAFNDAKVTAHHGIVPTANERGVHVDALNERERNIFALIAANFVAQFHPSEQYEATEVVVDVGGEDFRATGRRVIAPGWTTVFEEPADAEADDTPKETKQPLPGLSIGEAIANKGVVAASKATTPPARFTEALLLKAMANIHVYVANPQAKARLKEGQGIGTPATRANIIEELKSPKRGYLQAKGKQLISTPEARALIAALPPVATDAGFTGITEQTLDSVASGQMPASVFMAKTVELVGTLVRKAQDTPLKLPPAVKIQCPACKIGDLKKRKGANGVFWGCSRYNDGCKASYDDYRGKPKTSASGSGGRKPAKKATKKASRAAPGRAVKKTAARSPRADLERGS